MKPNFLWISLEDTSPRFGCYGDKIARTPNLDRLASEGILYNNAFSTSGVCSPSRSCIITGCYPTSIGTHHHRTTHLNKHTPEMCTPYDVVVPAYVKAFPEYLRAAGYYCTNNSKTDYQFQSPLSAWDECSESAHWRNRPTGTPFFAVFNLTHTHESGMWRDQPIQTDLNTIELPPYLPDTQKVREALAKQYDNIAVNDTRVGEILRELDQDGLANNTIVFIWSDHGEGIPRAKRWLYTAGTRIPLIVRGTKNIKPGTVSDDIISLVDLAPTVLSLAGVEIPFHMQGHPFLGEHAQERKYAFAARDRHDETYDMVRSVRDKEYQYIRNYHLEIPITDWVPYGYQQPAQQELWRLHAEDNLQEKQKLFFQKDRPAEELYDLQKDPWELENLAKKPAYRDTLKHMSKVLDEWLKKYGDMGQIPEFQMVRQMWPDGIQPTTAAVIFIPISVSNHGMEVSTASTLEGPIFIQLHSATQGASIVYTMNSGENPKWKLYGEPIRLPKGSSVTLRTRAVRIGYKDSEEKSATFVVS